MLQKGKVLGLFILLTFASCKSTERSVSTTPSTISKPAQVQVLATIHKFHLTNPNYSYSKVTQLIRKFDPDIIAVEIRPEDLKEDSTYLAQFYPLEMWQVLKDFPLDKVRGIDWYGNEMAGRKLPLDVFKNEETELGKIKKLEREMNRDSLVLPKLTALSSLAKQQAELAQKSSPAVLNNGEYDKVTDAYYKQLFAALKHTRYEAYAYFNQRRDMIISVNILQLVKENQGKRIIVLLGANHRSRAIKILENLPEEQLTLIPVSDQ